MSQLIDHGTVVTLKKNPDWCVVTDGYFAVDVYIPGGTVVQVGSSYQVYKQQNTYYLGQEIKAR